MSVKPHAAETGAPRKLSEMLRLQDLHVTSGRVNYRGGGGAKHADMPMVWDGLALDADMAQQSPSHRKP